MKMSFCYCCVDEKREKASRGVKKTKQNKWERERERERERESQELQASENKGKWWRRIQRRRGNEKW
jgi:hypothetical protein